MTPQFARQIIIPIRISSGANARDGVADALRLSSDRDPRITWKCDQIAEQRYALGIVIQLIRTTCIGCGCDDDHPCPGGCAWSIIAADQETGLCSACRNLLTLFHALPSKRKPKEKPCSIPLRL